jgi:hypothetical protein
VPRALFNGRYLTWRAGARRGGCLPLNNARGIGPLPSVMPDGTHGKYCKVDPVRIIRQKLPRFDLLVGQFRI